METERGRDKDAERCRQEIHLKGLGTWTPGPGEGTQRDRLSWTQQMEMVQEMEIGLV